MSVTEYEDCATLGLAQWAARSYATFSFAAVDRIVRAVSQAALDNVEELVQSQAGASGMGVTADASAAVSGDIAALLDLHRQDWVTPRAEADVTRVLRPLGVLTAHVGAVETGGVATGGVATVSDCVQAVLLALMTRNAALLWPANDITTSLVEVFGAAATRAGAPIGLLATVSGAPSTPMPSALADGSIVRLEAAAVPVYIDSSAEIGPAASTIIRSVGFNNGLSPAAETTLLVHESVLAQCVAEMVTAGAYELDADEQNLLIAAGLHQVAGWSARRLAERAGIAIAGDASVLLALSQEPDSRAWQLPILDVVSVSSARQANAIARRVVTGGGGIAGVHATNPVAIGEFSRDLDIRELVINSSTASARRSWEPMLLLRSTRIPSRNLVLPQRTVALPDRIPPYPRASNGTTASGTTASGTAASGTAVSGTTASEEAELAPLSSHDLSGGVEVLAQVSEVARLALARYGLSPAATVELITVSENATFRVSDPESASQMILRVHRYGYHRPGAIDSELDWLTALRTDAGIRTPAVISAQDGSRIVQVRGASGESRSCVMFELLAGSEPSADNLVAEYYGLGALTARMHDHAKQWRRPAGFVRFAWDADAAFGSTPRWGRWQDGIGVGPAEHTLLSRLQEVIEVRLAGFGRQQDRYGLIHADMRLANLLVVPGQPASVIDFDDCGWSWYLFDLAAALSFMEDDPQVPALIDAWLRGYRSVASLAAIEEAEIATFLMFRRLLLLAWIGSHPAAEMAIDLGDTFAAHTCELAEKYLSARC